MLLTKGSCLENSHFDALLALSFDTLLTEHYLQAYLKNHRNCQRRNTSSATRKISEKNLLHILDILIFLG
jgi:hypothetical protein